MDGDKLVRMANQIADFFRAYPAEQAAAGIVEHVKQFWTPGMRAALAARMAADPGGASPLVVRAFTRGAAVDSPALKEAQGQMALGQMASDAG